MNIAYLLDATALILLILAFIKKKSKTIPILILTIRLLIAVGGTASPDMLNMMYRFNDGNYGDLPIGFTVIYKAIREAGFSFSGFKILYMASIYIPIYKIYKKHSTHIAAALALLILFPLPDFTSQIRNSLAAVYAMVALLWYIRSEKQWSWLWYTIVICLCGSIHPATLVYLVALFSKFNIKVREMALAMVFFAFLVLVMLKTGLLYKLVTMVTSYGRFTQWFANGETWGNNLPIFLFTTVGQFAATMTMAYACNRIAVQQRTNLELQDYYRRRKVIPLSANEVQRLTRVNALLMVVLPFYVMSPMYFRMFKYVLILDYIVLCQAAFDRKRKDNLLYLWVALLALMGNLVSKRNASPIIFDFTFLESFSFSNITLFS